jgi:ferredoxin
MEVIIDDELCFGCNLCVDICPEVFKISQEKAVIIKNSVTKETEIACKTASDQCPVAAITIV